MTEHPFSIEHMPAVLYGEPSKRAYLFVHGQCGCKEEGAALTVMENGEHWFHTPEQLAVLREWENAQTQPNTDTLK